MKTILFLLLLCGIANADVYVLTDSSNNVLGLSEQNDMVAPSGDTINKIANVKISGLPITGDPKMYTFSNGTFTINSAKIAAQQAAVAAQVATQTAQQTALCTDYAEYQALEASLGVADKATTAQIQASLDTLEGDGSNQANVNNAVKISLQFLAIMNDIQQNGGSWATITHC